MGGFPGKHCGTTIFRVVSRDRCPS